MPPKKATATKADDPEEEVRQYIQRYNRPFNSNDIFNALQGAVSKTGVTKALNSLAESNEVVVKTFGKSTVYFPCQKDEDCPTAEEAQAMDVEINHLKDSVPQLQATTAAKAKELSALTAALPTSELAAHVQELRDRHAHLLSRLEAVRPSSQGTDASGSLARVTPEAKEEAEQERGKLRTAWAKRKRMFRDAWNAITEDNPTKPKVLAEELGIETDEQAGVSIDSIPMPAPAKRGAAGLGAKRAAPARAAPAKRRKM
ncbi:hypothetical protein H9P43_001748 [Blastocladiella emersonii ATCC 22665]|nr:hypothetical protein H9P43_001748 [Blastocladiella emersonii ATCC 22665]